jgi:hypothetical protein
LLVGVSLLTAAGGLLQAGAVHADTGPTGVSFDASAVPATASRDATIQPVQAGAVTPVISFVQDTPVSLAAPVLPDEAQPLPVPQTLPDQEGQPVAQQAPMLSAS